MATSLPHASDTLRPTLSPPWRILVVEDHPINQLVAKEMLDELGYQVVLAQDGQDALDILAEQTFDLIFMDVQMPRLDGLEATRRIRQQWPERGPYIIALTAHTLQEDRRRCFEAGMDAFLSKPLRLDTLRRTMDELPCPEASLQTVSA